MRERLRAALRWLGRATLALLAFALLFPLLHRAVAAPATRTVPAALPMPPEGRHAIWVVDWGYHTAIVVPQPAGWRLGPPGQEGAAYLEYAWGDRRFYRDSDYRPHALFATLVLPTGAVTYVAARDRAPTRAAGARSVHRREVDAATLRALVAGLEGSIVRDARGGRIAATAPVPGYRGRFYAAHGRYLWTGNCNAWTVARLADAGLARAGGLVVFSGQVAGRLVGFAPT